MEPKPLILDLTKKAIQSKPDPDYYFQVIGIASTAKAGYFELYKHQPHILFLDPDLPDEEGSSFIGHALERLPYLKIVALSSMFREQQMLEAGAHAFISVPIQKTLIWRKLDELVEELDEMGLLETGENQEEPDRKDTTGLFEFEDPSENPEYTPLFEDLFKKPEDKEKQHADQNPVVDDGDAVVLSFEEKESPATGEGDIVILDEEVPVSEKSPYPAEEPEWTKSAIIVADKPEDKDASEDVSEAEDVLSEPEQSAEDTYPVVEDLIAFDPDALKKSKSVTQPDAKESTSQMSGDGGEKAPVEPSEPDAGHPDGHLDLFLLEEKSEEADKKPDTEHEGEKPSEPSFFLFDTETEEKSEEENRDESPLSNADHFPFELKTKETPETKDTVEPKREKFFSLKTDLFLFEEEDVKDPPPEDPKTQQQSSESTLKGSSLKPPNTPSDGRENTQNATLFAFGEEKPEEPTPRREPVRPASPGSSNQARPGRHLYDRPTEYNKSTMPGKHPSGQGYYNRHRQFVPLYPPRERFPLSEAGSAEETETATDGGTPKTRDPDAGVFSVVKRIFKRQ